LAKGDFAVKKFLILVFGLSLVLAACGGGGNDQESGTNGGTDQAENTASAEDLIKQNCTSCHGQNLEGASGPSLQKVGSKYSKDEIKDIILNGKGAMPKGLLNDSEADVVAEWLAGQK